MMDTPEMSDDEIVSKAMLVANDTIKRRNERIKALETQADGAVMDTTDTHIKNKVGDDD